MHIYLQNQLSHHKSFCKFWFWFPIESSKIYTECPYCRQLIVIEMEDSYFEPTEVITMWKAHNNRENVVQLSLLIAPFVAEW